MTQLTKDKPLVFHFKDKANCRGGVTIVFDPPTNQFGIAACSNKDGYSRKRGVAIYRGRIEPKGRVMRQFSGKKFLVRTLFENKTPTFDQVKAEACKLAAEVANVTGLGKRVLRTKVTPNENFLNSLGIHDPQLRELAVKNLPCGEKSIKVALNDETAVQINAPRALAMCAYASYISALVSVSRLESSTDE